MRRPTLLGMLVTGSVLAGGFEAPDARAGDPPPVPARARDLTTRVNAAIDKGVAYLRSVQAPDGTFVDDPMFPGAVSALAYCALRASRVPAQDPSAVRAFSTIRKSWDAARGGSSPGTAVDIKTYTAAIFCMALAEHGTPPSAPDPSGERRTTLTPEDASWMGEIVGALEGLQDAKGRWGYGWGHRVSDPYDNSNTQYALLGLKAASRAGVRAKTATWKKSLQHLVVDQQSSGKPVPRDPAGFPGEVKGRTGMRLVDHARAWPYNAEDRDPRFSMTAGGVGSVVICRSELLGDPQYETSLDSRAMRSAYDGIAWLGTHIDDDNTFDLAFAGKYGWGSWESYSIYAVERAGVLAGVERMGRHDWYGEGAEFLCRLQSRNGSWFARGARPEEKPPGADETVVSTCFALLFLARGTPPVGRGSLTQVSDDAGVNFEAAGALSDKDFEDFIDLVLSLWRRAPEAEVKDRILARATAVGPRIVAPLVARLSSPKDEERAAAFALIHRATGLDHGYAPGGAPAAREEAAARWRTWLTDHAATLRYDPDSGRILPP